MMIQAVCVFPHKRFHHAQIDFAKGSVLIISFGERKSLSAHHPSLIFQTFPTTFPRLTTYSAEVNIGIIAACLPTLLPLYRLLRDKIIAARKHLKSRRSRSPQPLCHHSGGRNTSTQQPAAWESQTEVEMGTPHSAQWVRPTPRTFLGGEMARDEDVETQTELAKLY